jgi:hypothetical protein
VVTTPAVSAPLDQITTALLNLLNASSRKVWDGAYGGSPTAPTYPYGILYRIAGGTSDFTPDLGDSRPTVVVPYQVTAVSNVRNQCEQTGRVFRDRILARTRDGFTYPLAMPDGWACTDRRPDPVMPGIDRTGDVPNAIFTLPARFYLTIARV